MTYNANRNNVMMRSYKLLAILILVLNILTRSGAKKEKSCSALPPKLTFSRNDTVWTYKPSEASLALDFDDFLFFSRDWCTITTKEEGEAYYPFFKVDLISTTKRRQNDHENLRSREAVRDRCRKLPRGSFVQASTILHVNKTKHTFNYVQV